MDGRTDPLNDAAVDREIESLFEVDPSSDFVARVRSRVADESMSAGWGWRWPIAAIATAVAITAVGVAVWRSGETTAPATEPVAPRVAVADVPAPLVPPKDEPVAVPAHRDLTRVAAAPRRTIEIALPAVIIAENERRAFATFVADRRETRVEVSLAAARTVENPIDVDKMPEIEPVALKPIEIEPLVKVVELE
jgi:hypothetical protein